MVKRITGEQTPRRRRHRPGGSKPYSYASREDRRQRYRKPRPPGGPEPRWRPEEARHGEAVTTEACTINGGLAASSGTCPRR